MKVPNLIVSIFTAAAVFALVPKAHADLVISSGTTITSSNPIDLGIDALYVTSNSGTPTLTITGGTVTDGSANIGWNGNGAVNITSGTWASSQGIYFGSTGLGNLTMSGGTITDYGVCLGVYDGTTTATVTGGTWSTLSGGFGFTLGNSGTATLNLTGGTVSSDTMMIANNAGSSGTLNLGTAITTRSTGWG